MLIQRNSESCLNVHRHTIYSATVFTCYHFIHIAKSFAFLHCRIDRAVSRVYRLAMQDFTNTRLVSSCVAFLEMVDRDSRLLRVDTQAAVRIACHTLSPSSSPPLTEKLCMCALSTSILHLVHVNNSRHYACMVMFV